MTKLWKSEPIAILGAVQAIAMIVLTLFKLDPALQASLATALAAVLAVIGRSQVVVPAPVVVSPPAMDPEPTAAVPAATSQPAPVTPEPPATAS